MDFNWIGDPQAWIALGTLALLEIVLGIDNIIFIAILSDKLPEEKRKKARTIGLGLAMFTRILLLLSLSWIMRLTAPLFTLFNHGFAGRDLILIGGGLFLMVKSVLEIHEKIEGPHNEDVLIKKSGASFMSVIIQIMFLDIIFSFDSVITAVGLADQVMIMIIAVVLAVIVMMIFVNPISDFAGKHPSIKVLALSFLILIGFTLVGEGFALHIPKGYVYFAMAFSTMVELINMKVRETFGKSGNAAS